MAPELSLGRREAYVLKGKGEGRRILGQVIVPNTSSKSWEGGEPEDYLPRWVKQGLVLERRKGARRKQGCFPSGLKVADKGLYWLECAGRSGWAKVVREGGGTGGKRAPWGFFFRRPIEQPTGGNEGVWVLTRRLPGFRAGAVG